MSAHRWHTASPAGEARRERAGDQAEVAGCVMGESQSSWFLLACGQQAVMPGSSSASRTHAS